MNILDLDLRDKHATYEMFVIQHAEVDRVLIAWYTQSRGVPPMEHDMRHIYWRIIEEREVWGTLRNALQTTWPIAGGGAGGVPPPLQPPPSPPPQQPSPSGTGRLESAGIGEVRPRQGARNIPHRAGPFTTEGYGTFMVRLVEHGGGLVYAAGYPYWPMINQHTGRRVLHVMLSIDGTLHVVTVDKVSGEVQGREPLPFAGTGEKVYWSLSDPDVLYVPQDGGLIAWNAGEHSAAVAIPGIGASHFTTSHDGRVHAMIFEGNPAAFLNGKVKAFPRIGDLDEPQVDKSGIWLVSKEKGNDGKFGNRIIHAASEREWFILKSQRGLGHSDTGWACMVGEDDVTDPGGVVRLWRFTLDGPVDDGVVFHWGGWASTTRYVSFCNARSGDVRAQRAVVSSASNMDRLHVNEVVEISLDGSMRCQVLCPNFTNLDAPGIDPYWRHPRANICPADAWVCFTANTDEGMIPLLVRL